MRKTNVLHMRKQRRGTREANQRLCLRYIDSAIPLLSKSETILCSCTAWFVSDQVGNEIVGFLITRLKYTKSAMSGFNRQQPDCVTAL